MGFVRVLFGTDEFLQENPPEENAPEKAAQEAVDRAPGT